VIRCWDAIALALGPTDRGTRPISARSTARSARSRSTNRNRKPKYAWSSSGGGQDPRLAGPRRRTSRTWTQRRRRPHGKGERILKQRVYAVDSPRVRASGFSLEVQTNTGKTNRRPSRDLVPAQKGKGFPQKRSRAPVRRPTAGRSHRPLRRTADTHHLRLHNPLQPRQIVQGETREGGEYRRRQSGVFVRRAISRKSSASSSAPRCLGGSTSHSR